jgi:uncharacterized protein
MSEVGPVIMALGPPIQAVDLAVGVAQLARPRSYYFGARGLPQTGLDRTIGYRWEPQNRIGRRPAMQFLGTGEETVSIKGVIYPPQFGSFDAFEQMREEAMMGIPRGMVTQYGRYYGVWCIKSIKDVQAPYWPDGSPRKVEFNIDLVAYGPDGFGGFGVFG